MCSASPCSWLAVSKEAGTTSAHAHGHEKDLKHQGQLCPRRSTPRRAPSLTLGRLQAEGLHILSCAGYQSDEVGKTDARSRKISRAPGQVVRETRLDRRGRVPMRLAAGVSPACRQTSPVPLLSCVSLALLKPMHGISVTRVSVGQVVRAIAPCLDERRCDKAGLVAPRDNITMLLALYLYLRIGGRRAWLQCASGRLYRLDRCRQLGKPRGFGAQNIPNHNQVGLDPHWSGSCSFRSSVGSSLRLSELRSVQTCSIKGSKPESLHCIPGVPLIDSAAAPSPQEPNSRRDPMHSPMSSCSVGSTGLKVVGLSADACRANN